MAIVTPSPLNTFFVCSYNLLDIDEVTSLDVSVFSFYVAVIVAAYIAVV